MPKRFEHFVVSENINIEDEVPIDQRQFKTRVYFPTIDLILMAINERFNKCASVINASSALHPENDDFLSYEIVRPLAEHYKIELDSLKAEFTILCKTIKQYELEKNIKISNIMQLLDLLEIYNSSLFDEFVCKLGLFWHAWAILKRE
jgi:hypothetical protein